MICSETTPTARKAAHARPAPSPNRLVKVEAIQSVESKLVVGLCCSTFDGAGFSCSDEELLRDGDGEEFAAVGKVGLKVKGFVRKLSDKFW